MFYRLYFLWKTVAETTRIQDVKDFGAWNSNAIWAYVQKSAFKNIPMKLTKALKSA